MTFLQALILWSFHKINGERTIYSVYHLLKGKKSSQTIQDAHFFKLESIFQTFPSIQRSEFDQIIAELERQSFISINTEKKSCITGHGLNMLGDIFSAQSIYYLNGLKYQDTAILFWRRLSLMVQVISNLINNKTKYYPVQSDHDIQAWMKAVLRKRTGSKNQLSLELHQELFELFSGNPPEDPTILLIRLTGYQQIGKTIDQAAKFLRIEKTEYWYRFLHLLHYILESIVMDHKRYPLLFLLVSDSYQDIPLTISTKKTYQLLKQGRTISQIASIRKLKENTIEDHIIEIALNDSNFNISSLLDIEMEQRIIKAAAHLGQKKLKPIKDHIGNVSYFQIRLALAKKGEWV